MTRRLLTMLLLLLSASTLHAQSDYTSTPNLGLRKPKLGSTNWGIYVNQDFDTLDSAVGVFKGGFVTVPFSATPQFDMRLGNTFQITLTGDVTSSTANQPLIQPGQLMYLITCQDAVGGHLFAFPASFQTPTPNVTSTASKCSDTTWQWNGSVWISAGGGAGGGGGANPAPPALSLQKADPTVTTLQASSITDDGTNVTITEQTKHNANVAFKGPNPYIDVSLYGVRGGSATTTATTISGQPTVTLAAASTFQNGDGVTIYGAGATNTMSTPGAPTVVTRLARVLTATNDVTTTGLTGATTYNYQIIARDFGGGFTAAGATGSVTTGPSALGSQSVSVTGCTRAIATVTCTTGSAHGLVVGAMVLINGFSNANDQSFDGLWQVSATADNTHFQFTGGQVVANGAPASTTTTATVYWYNCNHITWTAVTGASQYYIYSDTGSPGTFNLIGASWPVNSQNSGFVDGTLSFDDFGSTMTSNFTAKPASIPTTAPSVATNDYLTTTISSGAGTTTLTLTANAGQSVSGTILDDDAPAYKAAATAANGLPIVAPFGVLPIINSPLDLSTINPTLVGGMTLNDTMKLGSQTKWDGNIYPVRNSAGQFQFQSVPTVSCNVSPCVHVLNNNAPLVQHLQFNMKGNGQVAMVVDGGGGQPSGEYNYLYFASPGNDYTNIGLIFRGVTGASSGARMRGINLTGTQLAVGTTVTPMLYCDDCGPLSIESIFSSGRSMLYRPDTAGGNITIDRGYIQGSPGAFLTVAGGLGAGNAGTVVDMKNIVLDTTVLPGLVYLPSTGVTSIQARFYGVGTPSLGTPQVTGNALQSLFGGSGQNTATTTNGGAGQGNNFTDLTVGVTGVGGFSALFPQPAAPTVAVVAGTNNSVQTTAVGITWVDGAGHISGFCGTNSVGNLVCGLGLTSAVVLTTGNQNFNVVPPTPPNGAIGYYMWKADGTGPLTVGSASCVTALVTPANATANDVRIGNCGLINPGGGAGFASINANGLTGNSLILGGGSAKSTRSGTFTANRVITELDASYTPAGTNVAQTFTSNQTIDNSHQLRFLSSNGTNYAGFQGGASTSNLVWLFPTTDSSGTQCLSSNGSLQLAWSNCSGGTGTPGGSNTQVQFNNSGSFGGSTNLTWVSPKLTIGVATSTTGQLALTGATSGTATITAQATQSTPTLTLPDTTGTFATNVTTPITLDTTHGTVACATCTTNASALTSNQLVIGGGGQAVAALGSLGTTTTVLHGNAGGAPSFAAVTLTTDVTGALPIANGGTGQTTASAGFNALSPMTTAGDVIYGGASGAGTRLAAGTSTQVFHSGTTPSWSAITLTTDVTGTLPIANGGSGQTTASAAFNALSPITSTGDLIVGTGTNTAGRLAVGGNGTCLVSNGTTWAAGSCAAGAVSGAATSGQGTFWNGSSTIAGNANWTYNAASGHTVTQGANNTDLFAGFRFTDSAPTGNLLHFRNAANSVDLFKLDVLGNLTTAGTITFSSSTAGTLQLTQGTAPSLAANAIQLIAPTSVAATGEQFTFPGTPSSGFIRWTNTSGTLAGAFAPASGVGACPGGANPGQVVTSANDNAAPTCSNVTASMFTSQAANTFLAAPNGSAGVPTFRTLVSADYPAANLASNANGGVTGVLPIANGGTNATTALAAFNNLSPLTTAGDVLYGGASGSGTRLAAGTATQLLHSGTTPSWSAVSLTADVSGILPIANGGTNATSANYSSNGAMYYDGTRLVTTATGGGGTLCLVSTGGGAPVFGSCSGSAATAWSSLTNPSGALSLSMGTNNTTFTSGVLTSTNNGWDFLDGNSTSTGSLVEFHTGTTSTIHPFTVTAKGTSNGFQVSNTGAVAAIGSGTIQADLMSLNIVTSSPLGGGQSPFNSNMTLTCTTCVTSGSALTNNQIVIGSGGGQGTAALGSLGTTTTLLHGNASGAPTFSSVATGDIAANAVTAAKSAVVLTDRVCTMIIGADNGAALANADIAPQLQQCQIPYAATVFEIDVRADGGTPSVVVAKRHCTASACTVGANETVTDLLSSALATGTAGAAACSNTGGTAGLDTFTTCSSTLQNTSLSVGDYLETHTATAGGTAKRMSIFVHYTVN